MVSGPPKAVLFDVGMTLVHADGEFLVTELSAEGITGLPIELATAAMVTSFPARHLPLPRGRDYVDKTGLTLAALLDIPQAEACRALRRVFARPDLFRLLDPDAIPALTALRHAGVRLGVISNSDGGLDEELDSYGLLGFFEMVLDSHDIGTEKPDPKIFEIGLERMGLDGSDCWYVGDNLINDIIGAKAANFAETVMYDRFRIYGHIPGTLHIDALSQLTPLVLEGTSVAAGRP
ncbi:HAD-IA family hydrolase [Micromonospora sp. NPDC049060]|uniref:HAD family hydrolase n=1 Tax=Micromonospora sp. NPDC049060 TaxID=3154828 RepID=UPI0033F90990